MNQIRVALADGVSSEQSKIMNLLVGVTMGSSLYPEYKKLCVDFIRDLEKYLDKEDLQ